MTVTSLYEIGTNVCFYRMKYKKINNKIVTKKGIEWGKIINAIYTSDRNLWRYVIQYIVKENNVTKKCICIREEGEVALNSQILDQIKELYNNGN